VLKWIRATIDNNRIQKLEAEVADLRREHQLMRHQNVAMIECVENISKYEKQLIEAIEVLTEDFASVIDKTTNNNGENR
tara:strand:- start:532 stop:768 length:237 start_codon:yes stop_codon:yes gene_type:complete